MVPFQPVVEAGLIRAKVIYIDNYENAVTNVSEAFFREHVRSKAFNISFLTQRHSINKISRSYRDANAGEMLALFNTAGMLEIAINSGKAKSLLGLDVDAHVRIEF
jgi:S-adenosylmethionine hydrolase